MTNRELISSIINSVRANNIDDRISQRYVLSLLRDTAALFIKRENDQFRLFNQQDIWTTVECLEMEEFDIVKCCDIQINKCQFVMRSVDKIPDIYTYRGGLVIREVMSMDGSKNFIQTTPIGYKNTLDREFVDKRLKYFWFENGHLIIPDSMVKSIRITAYFREIDKAKQLGCTSKGDVNCISPLDEEFQAPAHLVSTITESVLNTIMNTVKRVVVDDVENGASNIKNSNK